jgi:hypothetical protein
MTNQRIFVYAAVLLWLSALVNPSFAQPQGHMPETIMVVLHVKPGAEAELQRVLEQHWTTAHEMKLVTDTPHLTMRCLENGNKMYFIDVFTWREASIPDAAPAEIRKLWEEMNRLVENREGHQGLELVPVSIVSR